MYVGLRPLLSGTADQTTKLSREHIVASAAPGLTVVAGGKYTTYRVMAKDVIDAAVEDLDTADGAKIPDSVTDKVPVLGAEGFAARWNERGRIARRTGLHQVRVEHLLRRYGSCLEELLELIAADASLAEPIAGADDYLRVEAVYAASHEGALHLEDVLTRRTRISIETWDRGVAAAPEVAALIAPVLGWTEATAREEVERYLARVEAERASQAREDDSDANAVRRAAPDLLDVARGGHAAGSEGAGGGAAVDAATCGAVAPEHRG